MSEDHNDLEFNLDELRSVFGEPTELSQPERQYFWFNYDGHPERSVTLTVSKYERRVSVIIRSVATASSFSIEQADWVRVLEAERRTLEIVSTSSQSRCFIALDGESLAEVSVGSLDG